MSLTYDAAKKEWSYTPEKIDYPTNAKTDYPTNLQKVVSQWITKPVTTWTPGPNGGTWTTSYVPDLVTYYVPDTTANELNKKLNEQAQADNAANNALNKKNTAKNTLSTNTLNIANSTRQGSYNYLSAKQAIQNNNYQNFINAGLSPVDAQIEIDKAIGSTGQFRNFYITERITPWDPSVLPANLSSTVKERTDLGAQFNRYQNGAYGYYVNETPQGKAAKAVWDAAVAADNLDIIARYGSLEAYAKQDYLNQITDPTKSAADIASIRGSQVAPLSSLVTDYREQVFPDAQGQKLRDDVQNKIFGLQPITTSGQTGYQFKDITQGLSDLVTSDPKINKLWTDAKNEINLANLSPNPVAGPWAKLLNSLNVNGSMILDKDSFGSLLGRIATLNANDTADQQILADNYDLTKTISGLKNNTIFADLVSYTPEVNDAFTASVQSSEAERTKKFAQLRQNVLQDTINELRAAKQKEVNLSFFKSSFVGQEFSALQQDLSSSILGDIGVGGINPMGQSQKTLQKQIDTGLGDIFGTKNGLIYNWEDWFNNQIEKKYAGGVDIPNDYVPPRLRTLHDGFVDDTTAKNWKKYDDAYAALKINPNDLFAKAVISDIPSDYIPVENRKTVLPSWVDYENKLKEAGYVDPATLSKWANYDKAYSTLQKDPNNTEAQKIYAARPADYITPDKRMDQDVQFAKDFFSQYLKPRFDSSQSISEFQDYIDVTKNTQNPFQTQDRLDALKLAAQSSVSQWFTNLQKAGDSKFNADYYFDPISYLKTNGVGDPTNPLLPGAAFNDYGTTAAGVGAAQQSAKINADWEAAKQGQSTFDDYGKPINWLQQAYNYGIDLNDKAAFAKLHYQLVGMNAAEKDAAGNIIKNPDGTIAKKPYDPAPDVYAPQIAKTYIAQILTPFLIDKANKIGTVFGEFVKPVDYVNEVLKAVNLPENKAQWKKILETYGIDPNSSLDEIKTTLVDALSQDSTKEIKQKIGDVLKADKSLTQTELGVEFIQRPSTVSGKVPEASGIYAVFKNAGFNGTEDQFYSTFLPDASQQEISVLNASYAPSGKTIPLLPTITGTGMEQIASMAQLFGDTSIQEILGTAGVVTPSGKPSLLAGLLTTSGEDTGIGDPFADTSTPFTTVSGTTQKGSTDQMGIGNPFDVVGITDPFAEESDPFASSNPFSSIGSTSSISKPTIKTNANVFTQGFSSSKSISTGSLFDSFGGGFGF